MVNKISNNKDNVIRLVLLVVTDVVFITNIFIGCLAASGVTAVLLVRLVLILFCIYLRILKFLLSISLLTFDSLVLEKLYRRSVM